MTDAASSDHESDKDRGLYPKFLVRRVDGRDVPGGDREIAQHGYFVLDPIFDPMSFAALSLYVLLARDHGYDALADDIESNLRLIAADKAPHLPQDAKVRAVATWTYDPAPGHAYKEDVGIDRAARLTVVEKAALDAEGIEENGLSPEEIVSHAIEGSFGFSLVADA